MLKLIDFVKSNITQILRYVVVGVMNNLVGYGIYIAITYVGVDPKITVMLLYPAAALLGYIGNANLVFSYNGENSKAAQRYILAHIIGYLSNLSILFVFVDMLHFPHQLVQIVAIGIVAGILFLLFRYFVFTSSSFDQ